MAFAGQTFSVLQTLTSAEMNQVDTNIDEVRRQHKANSAPPELAAGVSWLDDSADPWIAQVYDGGAHIPWGQFFPQSNTFRPVQDGVLLGTAALQDVGTNSLQNVPNMEDIQNMSGVYFSNVGSIDNYAITPAPEISAYAAGQRFRTLIQSGNSGASNFNVSAVGSKAIVKEGSTALVAGDIQPNTIVDVEYDGTSFQLLAPAPLSKFVLIATTTASNAASADFPAELNSTYEQYLIIGTDIHSHNDDVILMCRTDSNGGASYDTAATDYGWAVDGQSLSQILDTSDNSDTEIQISGQTPATFGFGNAATESGFLDLFINNPAGTTYWKGVTWKCGWNTAGGDQAIVNGMGARRATAAIDSIQLLFNLGNISGVFRLYGLANS